MLRLLALLVAVVCPIAGRAAPPPVYTTATLSFSITIPSFIFLRVGSGGTSPYSTNPVIDSVVFSVPLAQIGSGSAITGSGGDLGNGSVTAQARSTVGAMQVRSNVTGALSNGKGDFIPWSQIGIVYSTVVGPVGNAIFPTSTTVVDGWSINVGATEWLDGTWTFRYLNQQIVPPGSYGGTVAKNGRVTYTATAI